MDLSHDFSLESCEAEGESRIRPEKIARHTVKTNLREEEDE